jgi:hypothetical protein
VESTNTQKSKHTGKRALCNIGINISSNINDSRIYFYPVSQLARAVSLRDALNSVVVLSKIRDALLINNAATHGSQFFDVLVLLIYSAGQEIISKIGEAISVLVARMQPHRKAAKAWKVGGFRSFHSF